MTPNPGSKEAVEQGCTCAQMDNGYGRGLYRDPKTGEWLFVINEECSLHGTPSGDRPVSEEEK